MSTHFLEGDTLRHGYGNDKGRQRLRIASAHYIGNKHIKELAFNVPAIKIKGRAFAQAQALHKITIKSNEICIEGRAFEDCTMLTHCTISSNAVYFGDFVFSNTKLFIARLPVSTMSIGRGLFHGCKHLKHVIVPSNQAMKALMKATDTLDGCENVASIITPHHVFDATGVRSHDSWLNQSRPTTGTATRIRNEILDIKEYVFTTNDLNVMPVKSLEAFYERIGQRMQWDDPPPLPDTFDPVFHDSLDTHPVDTVDTPRVDTVDTPRVEPNSISTSDNFNPLFKKQTTSTDALIDQAEDESDDDTDTFDYAFHDSMDTPRVDTMGTMGTMDTMGTPPVEPNSISTSDDFNPLFKKQKISTYASVDALIVQAEDEPDDDTDDVTDDESVDLLQPLSESYDNVGNTVDYNASIDAFDDQIDALESCTETDKCNINNQDCIECKETDGKDDVGDFIIVC